LRNPSRVRWVLCSLLFLAPALQAQSRSERAEAYLRSFHDVRRFNGAALVIDQGNVLFEGAFGFADREDGNAATRTTRFRIASLTKQFTAALILRLEELELLSVDAAVGEYIEAYPDPQASQITLHHLLSHTSGLPSYTNLPGFMEERADTPLSPGDIVALTWSLPLAFEPGTSFEYSNSGYVLLGWVAERVTGLSYDEALSRYVLEPLGLGDTGYDHSRVPPVGHAKGFTRGLTDYRPSRSIDPTLPFAAGMLYSTVADLGRWSAALLGWDDNSPFEHPASHERMLTPFRQSYGYGIEVRRRELGRDEDVRVVEHTGGIFGFSAIMRAFPDQHRLIVLLDNTGSDLGPIVEGLTNLLWGTEARAPKASIAERLLPIVESAGVEPALARYRTWRRTRPHEYEYGPGQLMQLAVHFRQRDPEISIALLEAQVEGYPELPMPRVALAELYAAKGARGRALSHLEEALTFNPGVPQVLERILALGSEPSAVLRLPVTTVPVDSLTALVGDYRVDPTTTLSVEFDGTSLTARRSDEAAFKLLPQSSTVFLLHGSKVQFVFELADGRSVAVSVLESDRRVRFPRIP